MKIVSCRDGEYLVPDGFFTRDEMVKLPEPPVDEEAEELAEEWWDRIGHDMAYGLENENPPIIRR